MFALPQKSLEYPKGLFEISSGTSRIFPYIKEGTTFKDRFRYSLVIVWLRVSWFLVNFLANSKIEDIVKTNEKFKLIDIYKLTSADYKGLRSFRDETEKQFKELNRLLTKDNAILPYQRKTLTRYVIPLEQRIKVLDNLFAKVNIPESHIEGFRVVSEEEAWQNRTTAYQYAT
jgi:uncharacterized membrane protein